MRLFLGSLVAFATLIVGQSSSSAQSWLGEPNGLTASFSHTYSKADKLIYPGGSNPADVPVNDVTHMVTTLGLDYVTPHDKLSLTVNVPVLTTKFDSDGSQPNPHVNPEWDDGDSHVALQDLGITANYQLFGNYTGAVIGSFGLGIPMSDYPVVGFDSPGRGLKEANFGLQGSMSFEEWVSGLYGMTAYRFSLVEKADQDPELEGFGQNKSAFMALIGYYITDDLEVNLNTDIVLHHGGIGFDELEPMGPKYEYHDVILDEQIYMAGLGVGYSITEKILARVFYSHWVGGKNTSNASVGGIALDWSIM